jgi:ribonucleotide reductase alpha subunit
MSITIDPSRDSLFDTLGLQRLRESYMMEEETSPQERFAYVSQAFSSNPEHAQRLYEYSSKHWLSYSTPILSFGRSKRGLPISCFLNYMDDSAEGLVNNLSETNWLSMLGGGVGVHLGIRNSDDKSTGVMPHLKMYDASPLWHTVRGAHGEEAMLHSWMLVTLTLLSFWKCVNLLVIKTYAPSTSIMVLISAISSWILLRHA